MNGARCSSSVRPLQLKASNQSSKLADKDTMTDAETLAKLGQLTDPELNLV